MKGESSRAMSAGLKAFIEAIKVNELSLSSVELSIITTGGRVLEKLSFSSVRSINIAPEFDCHGSHHLGEAISLALQRLEVRKAQYVHAGVGYRRPVLLVISRGNPDGNWQLAAQKAMAMSQKQGVEVFPVGIDGADLNILNHFAPQGAKQLDGAKFRELFEWLAAHICKHGHWSPPPPPWVLSNTVPEKRSSEPSPWEGLC